MHDHVLHSPGQQVITDSAQHLHGATHTGQPAGKYSITLLHP
jgi:hypothetical protein